MMGMHRLVGRLARTRRPAAALAAGLALCATSAAPALGQEVEPGEWTHYAGGVDGHKYSPLDQISTTNVQQLQVAWRYPSPDLAFQDDPILRRSRNEDTPLMANGQLYSITGLGIISALDPATGEVRWVYDPESYALGRPNNGGFLQRGMGYWTDGDGGAAAHRHRRRLPAVARCAHRPARPGVRRRRQGRPDHRHPGRRAQHQLLGAAAPGGRRHRRRRQLHRRLLAHAADAARRRAGVRRAHGPQALDVPHHPARVRSGLRDVAERLGRVHGQRERLGRHGLRPGARLRLHGHLHADQQLLRRRPARRQPVRREHHLRGGADRRARLALPGHPPRHLGLRLRRHAGAGRHHRRRPHDQGDHAGEQAGVHLRVRPRDRRAGLAHRGAPGAAVDRARRTGGADAAVPHEARRRSTCRARTRTT